MEVFEKIAPLYTVYYYTDFLFRVIKFKRRADGIRLTDDSSEDGPQERFEQSYCRSRSMVLQYALCNKWDYFITITVSPKRFDRWDLVRIYKALSQWFRDYRKLYGGVAYLLVPELHQDGAWHFHGLISGICPEHLSKFVSGIHPEKLVKAGYYNFGLLANFIGYVSLSPLRDPVGAAFYVTKYITKEHAHDEYYQHLYYHSRGLNTARPVADCYTYSPDLEKCLTHESDYCFSGWAKTHDFTFPFSVYGVEPRDFGALVPVSEEELTPDETNLIFVQYLGGEKVAELNGI